jgi:hypothetical protein
MWSSMSVCQQWTFNDSPWLKSCWFQTVSSCSCWQTSIGQPVTTWLEFKGMAQDPLVRRESVSASCNRRPMRVWRHKNTPYTRWRLSNGLGVYLSWLQAGFSHHSGHVTNKLRNSIYAYVLNYFFVFCFSVFVSAATAPATAAEVVVMVVVDTHHCSGVNVYGCCCLSVDFCWQKRIEHVQPIKWQNSYPMRWQNPVSINQSEAKKKKEPIRKQNTKRKNQSTPSTFFLSEKISSYRPKLYLL